MHPILAGGLLIGLLCGAFTVVFGITGWYKDPTMAAAFVPVVTILEVGVLIFALRKTALRGRVYSGQVVAGTMMALIGGVIIICSSLLFTNVLFPDYFAEINAMTREVMAAAGRSEADITAAIDAARPWQTPMKYALAGFLGTFMTGVIATAIISIWIRARGPLPPAARA